MISGAHTLHRLEALIRNIAIDDDPHTRAIRVEWALELAELVPMDDIKRDWRVGQILFYEKLDPMPEGSAHYRFICGWVDQLAEFLNPKENLDKYVQE